MTHGTSQIETVAAGVQQLCAALGPVAQEVGPDGQPGVQEGGVLADVHRMLLENKEREDGTAMLHDSVNGLMAAVQEELRRNEAQGTLSEFI